MAGAQSTIRYLSAADVGALMPPVAERLALARATLLATVANADLPPKNSIHPRPEASFANAMPAFLRGAGPDGDRMGMKWVAGFPTNRARNVPQINGLVLLNDAATGLPMAIMDAAAITAHRTAAVSGVVLEAWLRERGKGTLDPQATSELRVALLGAGVQAGSHLEVIEHLLPGATLVISDHNAERATALAERAKASGAMGDAQAAPTAAEAVRGAQVVMTMISFGPDRQSLSALDLEAARVVIGVDYDMCVPHELANAAPAFLVDDVEQFTSFRATGIFAGYRDPDTTIGRALSAGGGFPDGTVAIPMGIGLADVVFGSAIAEAAAARGVGLELPR